MDLSLLSPVQPRWFYVVVLRGCIISRITKGEIAWSVCKLDTMTIFMHTRFQGSLLLVAGRKGVEPWKRGCSCEVSRDLKQLRRRQQHQHQKTIGFMSKTKALHVQQDFSTFLWRPMHDYDVKPPNATFYGGRGHTTTNFPFSIWTWIKPLRIQLQEKSPTFDKFIDYG